MEQFLLEEYILEMIGTVLGIGLFIYLGWKKRKKTDGKILIENK